MKNKRYSVDSLTKALNGFLPFIMYSQPHYGYVQVAIKAFNKYLANLECKKVLEIKLSMVFNMTSANGSGSFNNMVTINFFTRGELMLSLNIVKINNCYTITVSETMSTENVKKYVSNDTLRDTLFEIFSLSDYAQFNHDSITVYGETYDTK